MAQLSYDAAYWRERAAKTRAKAQGFLLPRETEHLLRVAEEYERIAEIAERQNAPERAD